MTYSALLEDRWFMSMDFREPGFLMTVEAATPENETSTRIESVALCALNAGRRRMLMKSLVTGGGIGAHKKSHFFPAAAPMLTVRRALTFQSSHSWLPPVSPQFRGLYL